MARGPALVTSQFLNPAVTPVGPSPSMGHSLETNSYVVILLLNTYRIKTCWYIEKKIKFFNMVEIKTKSIHALIVPLETFDSYFVLLICLPP